MHSLVMKVNDSGGESVSERQTEDHRQIDLLRMPLWITVRFSDHKKDRYDVFTSYRPSRTYELPSTFLVGHSRRTNLDLDEPAIDDQACDLYEGTNRLHGVLITAKELLVTAIEAGEV